jgi:simple sugar transport system ATP-binding protein
MNVVTGLVCGMNDTPVVELRSISKSYLGGRKTANSNISLSLRRGEILCIAGENGAGKTTLMKILCGLETPDTGEIIINGKEVTVDSPLAARGLGIGMVHQHFMLFPQYTAAENIVMGVEPRKWGIFFDRAAARKAAGKVIESHHFSIAPDRPVHTMSVGEMQQVEICRLLHRNADIIIMDEPTAVLTERETAALFGTLKTLAVAGKSIFLITHKLREIKLVSDRVAVLRRGELAGIFNTNEIDEYGISRLMTGNNHGGLPRPEDCEQQSPVPSPQSLVPSTKTPVIVFDNVTVRRRGQALPLLDSLSFAVRPGEIVGFTGVGGNGLGVLEAVLGGFLHPAGGKITHNGENISRFNIRRLRGRGLAFVPSDRLKVGSAPEAAINENIIINSRKKFSHAGFLDQAGIRNYSQELIHRYNIAGTSDAKSAAALSGGNLQKLVLAREIDQTRDYIVFSEPTWGLDYAAGNFVRDEISALREKGMAVILISTDLDEIIDLADTIIVMYRGMAAGVFDNNIKIDTASLKEKIGNCMQGLSR